MITHIVPLPMPTQWKYRPREATCAECHRPFTKLNAAQKICGPVCRARRKRRRAERHVRRPLPGQQR